MKWQAGGQALHTMRMHWILKTTNSLLLGTTALCIITVIFTIMLPIEPYDEPLYEHHNVIDSRIFNICVSLEH
jgi:hypothetical protein